MRFGAVVVIGLMVASLGAAQQVNAPASQLPAKQQQNPAKQQQDVEQQKKPMIILRGVVTGLQGACPGALQAQQQAAGGAVIWTTALGDPSVTAIPQGLGIHVEFQGSKTAVKELELRVSYLPLGLRAMQVAPALTTAAAAQPQERAKTFNLDREAAMHIDGDLLVGPAATITRVHLLSATFADGSIWRAPTEDACTVVPNRMMQIASVR